MDKMSVVQLAIFVAEQLVRGGSSAGHRMRSTNKPRTGQNKPKAASSGGLSTKRGPERPKGSRDKPQHGQAAVQKPKAKTKAKAYMWLRKKEKSLSRVVVLEIALFHISTCLSLPSSSVCPYSLFPASLFVSPSLSVTGGYAVWV